MKRFILAGSLVLILMSTIAVISLCEENDPNQFFYKGSLFYEKREYQKAIEEYQKILDMGLENGRLYYNIGNCFFKMGNLGQAILYYEKAKRLIPQDGDLKSNLGYAKSFVAEIIPQTGIRKTAAEIIMMPLGDFNLNALAIAAAIVFIIFVIILSLFLINPFIHKKLAIPFFAVAALLVLSLLTFGVKYYNEEALKHGVVIQKDAECKYEPIDKSTTYYTLPEGTSVIITETRNGWSQVRRLDGKVGWLKKESVAEV